MLSSDNDRMAGGILELVEGNAALNSKIFSKTRLLILSVLDELPRNEGATFRELKAALKLNEGVLFTNLGVLAEMGYVVGSEVEVGKKMTSYHITDEGRLELGRVDAWLKKMIEGRSHEGKPG